MYFPTPLPLVPVVLIVVAWLGLYGSIRILGRDRFESVMAASIGLGIAHWLLSEIQSWSGLLSFSGAVTSWAITGGVSLLLFLHLRHRSRRTRATIGTEAKSPSTRGDQAILIAILLTVALIGLVAWLTPVMAWDALAYHVPRFLYWVQYGSIEPFPTANDRNIFMGPWPALTQMQIYLLAGSDRLVHALQWLSMVGSIIVAMAIARKLGAGRRGELTAAALVVTLPMGIQQATTALTDYTAALWLMILAYYSIAAYRESQFGWLERLAAGGALGLSVLSKATTIPMVVPFVVVLLWAESRRGRGVAWRTLLTMGLMAGLLNAPHLRRNFSTYGHPLAPSYHRELVRNQSFRPQYVISNLIRHTFVHLGTWNPDHARPLIALSDSIHRFMGLEDGDPLNSHKQQKLQIQPLRRNKELPGNPLHLLLYLLCGVWLLLNLRRLGKSQAVLFGLCLVTAAVLFASLVKYQLSIARLQLPLFVLASPWAAAVIDRWWSPRAVRLMVWLLLVAAMPGVAFFESRPLFGSESILTRERQSLLYGWGDHLERPVTTLANRVGKRNSKAVGLVTNGETLEYYIWYELRRETLTMPRITNLEPEEGFSPPLAVSRRPGRPPFFVGCFGLSEIPSIMTIGKRSYRKTRNWKWGSHATYERIRR